MIKRTFTNLSLIFLFALMQIGVAMHSISHLVDCDEALYQAQHHEQHQDGGGAESQCDLCLSLSQVDDVNLIRDYHFAVMSERYIVVANLLASTVVSRSFSYIARAPPQPSQV